MTATLTEVEYVRWFADIGLEDIPSVGGKNASLGEMFQTLRSQGVQVPNGFAITADAYRHFLRAAGTDRKIRNILSDLDTRDLDNLHDRGSRVRQAILAAEFPEELKEAILEAYQHLSDNQARPLDVAVRSSATAEDLPDASFAGQQGARYRQRLLGDVLRRHDILLLLGWFPSFLVV